MFSGAPYSGAPFSAVQRFAAPGGITGAVYVQANWPPGRAMDEVRFVAESARRAGFPVAIVAYADMLSGDVRPALDALAAESSVRGVRMQLHWHANPLYRFASGPDLARDPLLRRNVAKLAGYGWSFDLQVFAGQMEGAAELAEACPTDVLRSTLIINEPTKQAKGALAEALYFVSRAKQVNMGGFKLGIDCMRRDNMFTRDGLHPTHHRTCRLVLRFTFAPTETKKGSRQPDFIYWELTLLYRRAPLMASDCP